MRWAGHVARIGKRRYTYSVLVRKTEGKRPLGKSSRRWEDDIKIHIQKLGWRTWTALMWFRIGTAFVYAVMNLPSSIKCREFLD
jgi:hypothetical protein